MANHCYNFITFTGDMEQLKKLESRLEKIRTKQLKENYIDKGLAIPSYEESENSAWLNGINYHYILFKKVDDWLNSGEDVYEKYGSKWFEARWTLGDDSLEIAGDSAWSPMLPFFVKICRFYKLQGSGFYTESGMDFAGDFEMDEGGIIEHTATTYRAHLAKNSPEIFWEDILIWISDGVYNNLDAIFADFESVDWKLTPSEIEELEEAFKDFQNLPNP